MKDILSLPNDVLLRILSFLPTKEAITTSVVSKEWQKMVNSTPFLCFDDGSNSKRIKKVVAYNFMNFVDRVLFNHEGNVHKFSIQCGSHVDPDRLRRWIRYAISNRVRELDFKLRNYEWCSYDLDSLPFRVFTCQTMEVLRLRIINVIITNKVPAKIYLPNLKTLYLEGLRFRNWDDKGWIQKLISSCTMLEELEIHNCMFIKNCCSISVPTLKRLNLGFFEGKIHIDAPNLVYSKFCYFPENISLKNLSSLVEADISFSYDFKDYDTDRIDLFKAISNVKSLHMSGNLEDFFRRFGSVLPRLSKLTHLSFKSKFFTGWNRWISVLTQCFPYVEAFDLNVKHLSEYIMFNEADIPPPCSWPQLKKINILSFANNKSELLMIEYLLKNAVSLEKLTVSRSLGKFREELLKLKKASNKCEIIVL